MSNTISESLEGTPESSNAESNISILSKQVIDTIDKLTLKHALTEVKTIVQPFKFTEWGTLPLTKYTDPKGGIYFIGIIYGISNNGIRASIHVLKVSEELPIPKNTFDYENNPNFVFDPKYGEGERFGYITKIIETVKEEVKKEVVI